MKGLPKKQTTLSHLPHNTTRFDIKATSKNANMLSCKHEKLKKD